MTTQTQTLSDLVAENVRALMARTRTKQHDLADALHMTQGAVSKKVNGDRPFSLDELGTVARFFGVPIAVLFDPRPATVYVDPFQPAATGTQRNRNSSLTPQYVPDWSEYASNGAQPSFTDADWSEIAAYANEGVHA